MVNSEQSSLEHKLALLKQNYQQNLQVELTSLCHVLATLQQHVSDLLTTPADSDHGLLGSSPVDVLEDVYRRLHKLAGSAGTFGFDAIGNQAHSLEASLKGWLEESDRGIDLQLIAVINSQLQAMQAELLPSQQPQARKAEAKPDGCVFTARVWLIEEDAELGKRILEQLTNFSYDVRLFSSVPEACQEIGMETPDVLIVDAMSGFPHQSPLQALSCPLLFISDYDTFDDRLRAAQLNAYSYFLKPLNIPQLINRLEQLLQERHAQPARILVVDDDHQLAAYYQLVLEAAGMEARILDTPRHIIEQLGSFRPELLLMDVHMPECDGPDLASVVRQYDEWSLSLIHI